MRKPALKSCRRSMSARMGLTKSVMLMAAVISPKNSPPSLIAPPSIASHRPYATTSVATAKIMECGGKRHHERIDKTIKQTAITDRERA
jgi:hypothetical protein